LGTVGLRWWFYNYNDGIDATKLSDGSYQDGLGRNIDFDVGFNFFVGERGIDTTSSIGVLWFAPYMTFKHQFKTILDKTELVDNNKKVRSFYRHSFDVSLTGYGVSEERDDVIEDGWYAYLKLSYALRINSSIGLNIAYKGGREQPKFNTINTLNLGLSFYN
ncbi:MAG: hypothetical protein ABJP45_18610, partial [Cyclobacteriaceae bacterium]